MAVMLVALGVLWLAVLALLVLDLSGHRRRGANFRWQATGLLLINGVIGVSNIARERGWPSWQGGLVGLIEVPLVLLGLALLITGFVRQRA